MSTRIQVVTPERPRESREVLDVMAIVVDAAERVARRGDASNVPLLLAAASLLNGCAPRGAPEDRHLGLTEREYEVLGLVALGLTNAATADRLSIAPGTVKKHLDHIYTKLGVRSRTEAAVLAHAWGADGGA